MVCFSGDIIIKSMSIYLSSTGLQTIRKKLYMSQYPTKYGVEILPTFVSIMIILMFSIKVPIYRDFKDFFLV